jgi:hypothetical protein
MPKKGYLKNGNLAKLCDMKSNVVSRSPIGDTLRSQLDEMKPKLDKLSNDNSLGVDKIREHCDGLRNEVQLSSEELIQSIKKQNMYRKSEELIETTKLNNLALIEQIDAYESKSMLDFNKENKLRLDSFIQEKNVFRAKWVDYLNGVKLDENDLKTASTEAKACLEQINQETAQFILRLFNGNVLKFDKNLSQSSNSCKFGYFSSFHPRNYTHIKTDSIGTFIKADTDEIIFLSESVFFYAPNINKARPISIKFHFKDDQITVAYRTQPFDDVAIVVYDKYFKKVRDITLSAGRHFNKFQLIVDHDNNSIILCLTEPKNTYDNNFHEIDDQDVFQQYGETPTLLIQFDILLRMLNKIRLHYTVHSIDAYSNKIYCLSAKSNISTDRILCVFDCKLMFLEQIEYICNQYRLFHSSPSKFYIPHDANKIRVCKSQFVFFVAKKVILVSWSNRKLDRQFDIDSNDFTIKGGKIQTYNEKLDKVVSYDSSGKSEINTQLKMTNKTESIQIADWLEFIFKK